MELPPPSQILLQAEAAAAPPFFVPVSAASMLASKLSSVKKNVDGTPETLTTGVHAIDCEDGVLGGGLPTGTIIGISSDTATGLSRTLALKMLCRHLMKFGSKNERAMIIDSAGTFDIQTLLEVAKGCTTREYTHAGHRMVWRERMEVEGLMKRVGITRVFDVEGVWDVVAEIRASKMEEDEKQDAADVELKHEHQERIEERNDEQQKVGDEDHGIGHSSIMGGGSQEHGDKWEGQELRIRLQTPEAPPISAPSLDDHDMDGKKNRSDGNHPLGPLAVPSAIPDSPSPRRISGPASSPPTPPPPRTSNLVPVDTSSPLSSPPKSLSPSSSLRSELVIEPSPVRQNMNTVLSQAYAGEAAPSSSEEPLYEEEESGDEEEASDKDVKPSWPQATVLPSPLPPSSPPILQTPAPGFGLPTEGFEEHMSEAAQPDHYYSFSSSSPSDTSSYVSSPSPTRNQLPPGSQWDEASETQEPPSILLIDSLPPLLTNHFGNEDRTAAHRQLQQLSRMLTSLSRSTAHPLTVIVLNSTTTLSPAKSIEEGVARSAFADINHIPSFGAVYDGMIDINLLVSRLPASQGDAEAFYGGQGGVRWTNVVECLRDDTPDSQRWVQCEDGKEGNGRKEKKEGRPGRKMNREGRWGAFDVVIETSGEAEELVFKDPDLGRKLGVYEVVHFGRRP